MTLNLFFEDYFSPTQNLYWYGETRFMSYDIVDDTYVRNVSNPKNLLRVGSVFTQKLGDLMSPGDITHLCEQFRAWYNKDTNKYNWKILEGEDIRTGYYLKSYSKLTGSISNSCMRYKRCQPYFDIYVNNAKMLVLTPKRGYKIVGRALLWEINGNIYMDRVYGTDNSIVNLFYIYAKQNKFIIRENNDLLCFGCIQKWKTPEDNYCTAAVLDLKIDLPKEYSRYPYLDSFRYLSDNKSCLMTMPESRCWSGTDTYGGLDVCRY